MSAVLVHDWSGTIEAHFHYFVMIAVLALYEDWVPFGLSVLYVVIEHGLVGVISPHSVYDHPGSTSADRRFYGPNVFKCPEGVDQDDAAGGSGAYPTDTKNNAFTIANEI